MRVPEVVVGIMLVAGGALVAVVWHRSSVDPRPVVVAARDVHRGEVIEAEDLVAGEVSGAEGIQLVPGADARELVGRVALVDLSAGSPLTQDVLGDSAPLEADEGLIGVAVAPGEYPPGLAAGDHVRLVVTPSVDAEDSGARLLDATAEVWAIEPPTDVEARAVVTLRAPIELSVQLADGGSARLVQTESVP